MRAFFIIVLILFSPVSYADKGRPLVIFAAYATNYIGTSKFDIPVERGTIRNLLYIIGDALSKNDQVVVYINDLEHIPDELTQMVESYFEPGRVRAIPWAGDIASSLTPLPYVDEVYLTHPEKGAMLTITARAAKRFANRANMIIIDTHFDEIKMVFRSHNVPIKRTDQPAFDYIFPQETRAITSKDPFRYSVPASVDEEKISKGLRKAIKPRPSATWRSWFFQCAWLK